MGDSYKMSWYFLYIIFIMYCIMPVSLHWCLAMCLLSSVSHILTTLIKQPHGEQPSDTHNTYLMVASGNSQDAFIPSDDNNKSFVGSMPKRAQNCCIQLCDWLDALIQNKILSIYSQPDLIDPCVCWQSLCTRWPLCLWSTSPSTGRAPTPSTSPSASRGRRSWRPGGRWRLGSGPSRRTSDRQAEILTSQG